jgi:hypothetical protein
VHGFSLHANVSVPAHRRDQLERLIRYTARGAVSLERLEADANGDLLYTFTQPMVGRDHGHQTLAVGTAGEAGSASPHWSWARLLKRVFALEVVFAPTRGLSRGVSRVRATGGRQAKSALKSLSALKPTHTERTIWGEGDALGLQVYERPYGRLSGLNCWEHNIVLPGYVLMAQGTQIHVAAWPGREPPNAPETPIVLWPRQLLLSRPFASQAGCYVVLTGALRLAEHVPERYREFHRFDLTGDSSIIDPRGEVIAGPAQGETILTAQGSLEAVLAAKATCDVGGHYSRPDVLQLLVHRRPLERVIEHVHVDATAHAAVDVPAENPFGAQASAIDNDRERQQEGVPNRHGE